MKGVAGRVPGNTSGSTRIYETPKKDKRAEGLQREVRGLTEVQKEALGKPGSLSTLDLLGQSDRVRILFALVFELQSHAVAQAVLELMVTPPNPATPNTGTTAVCHHFQFESRINQCPREQNQSGGHGDSDCNGLTKKSRGGSFHPAPRCPWEASRPYSLDQQ